MLKAWEEIEINEEDKNMRMWIKKAYMLIRPHEKFCTGL